MDPQDKILIQKVHVHFTFITQHVPTSMLGNEDKIGNET